MLAGRLTVQTTDIRKGLKIQIDGVPYAVVEHQFVKPGRVRPSRVAASATSRPAL